MSVFYDLCTFALKVYNFKIKMCNIKESIQKEEKQCCLCRATFAICFLVSIVLIVTGFFIPPMGVIDGSVLTATGELLLFPTLLYGFRAVELGLEVKFQKGETSIEIHRDDDDV